MNCYVHIAYINLSLTYVIHQIRRLKLELSDDFRRPTWRRTPNNHCRPGTKEPLPGPQKPLPDIICSFSAYRVLKSWKSPSKNLSFPGNLGRSSGEHVCSLSFVVKCLIFWEEHLYSIMNIVLLRISTCMLNGWCHHTKWVSANVIEQMSCTVQYHAPRATPNLHESFDVSLYGGPAHRAQRHHLIDGFTTSRTHTHVPAW